MSLQIIEREDKRVLMTSQIAEAFGADQKTVNRNFQRNKDRFQEGLHFFALTGEALKQFKGERQNDATLKFTSNLYLWTEEGAFLLAKSLNTDKAWEAYNLLVNQYYKMEREIVKIQLQQPKPLTISYDQFQRLESRVEILEKQISEITLHSGEQLRLRKAVSERVYNLTEQKGARQILFRALYSAIKERYQVGSYRDIKQHQLQDALKFIKKWEGGAA